MNAAGGGCSAAPTGRRLELGPVIVITVWLPAPPTQEEQRGDG